MKLEETQDLERFGKQVKKLRNAKEFTQQKLADECEVDISTIQRIEKGTLNIGLYLVYVIARALKVEPKELFEE